MELETYEANLADIALQEQTFYETKPTLYELQMASQLMSNGQNGGNFMQSTNGAFPLITPILNNNGGKGKKKKSVKFLTYVQVSEKLSSSRDWFVREVTAINIAKRKFELLSRSSVTAWIQSEASFGIPIESPRSDEIVFFFGIFD